MAFRDLVFHCLSSVDCPSVRKIYITELSLFLMNVGKTDVKIVSLLRAALAS